MESTTMIKMNDKKLQNVLIENGITVHSFSPVKSSCVSTSDF